MTSSRGRLGFLSARRMGLHDLPTGKSPELKGDETMALTDTDKVACLMEYRGTHATFKREAVWREIWIVRLSEGKIVESWPLPDVDAYMRQLGCLA